MDYEDNNASYREQYNQTNDVEDKEDAPQDLLAAAGLEDSDVEDDQVTLSLSFSLFCVCVCGFQYPYI